MKPGIGAGSAIPELVRSGSRGRGRPSMLPWNEEAWSMNVEAERGSGMANEVCSAMMMCSCCTASKLGPGQLHSADK